MFLVAVWEQEVSSCTAMVLPPRNGLHSLESPENGTEAPVACAVDPVHRQRDDTILIQVGLIRLLRPLLIIGFINDKANSEELLVFGTDFAQIRFFWSCVHVLSSNLPCTNSSFHPV